MRRTFQAVTSLLFLANFLNAMDSADTYIFDRITVNPARCNGRPTIRGTRLTVTNILDFLGAGDSVEDMLDEYPQLAREDVLACIRFALATVREKYDPKLVTV